MGVGDDDDEDWNSESGEDDGDCEGCDDDVDLIETPSPAAEMPNPFCISPRGVRTTLFGCSLRESIPRQT